PCATHAKTFAATSSCRASWTRRSSSIGSPANAAAEMSKRCGVAGTPNRPWAVWARPGILHTRPSSSHRTKRATSPVLSWLSMADFLPRCGSQATTKNQTDSREKGRQRMSHEQIAPEMKIMPKVGSSPDDRMPPIPPERMTEAQRAVAEEFKAKRGHDVDGPFLALIRSPEIFKAADHLGRYIRFESPIPSKLKEMAILITARRWTQQYEWYTHRQVAMHAGLSPAIADAIAEGRVPDQLAEDEDAVYRFCTELHAKG